MAFTVVLLGACAAAPPKVDEYVVDIPQGIADRRGRFNEIFCAVLDARKQLADHMQCKQALTPLSTSPVGTGEPIELGASRLGLVAAIVPGLGWACFAEWLDPRGTATTHVRQYGYDMRVLEVDALSGIERNARQIRDAVMSSAYETASGRLVLVGYSKGTPDILEAVVRYPELRARTAAIVSVAGAVGGSALADDAEQWQAEFLRHWPGSKCDKGDRGAVASLRRDVRKAWLAENPLPADIRYYSLVALPLPERVSRALQSPHRELGKIDWRNDSQLIYADAIVPGSTLLGFLNADHWAVAVPVNRSHPTIAGRYVTQNAYPREALLEAILRFVEEDLSTRSDVRN